MRRIFVTGATGYIGGALCRLWAARGHRIQALVRPGSPTGELEALGVRCLRGDVTDRVSMREAMAGADWVVHAAAELDMRAPAERMRRVNSEGSDNVASLAWKLGVGRLLAFSSIAAFGGSPEDGSPVDEEAARRRVAGAYGATKSAGEEAVRRWAQQGLAVNVVYPSVVYGPPGKRMGVNALLRALIRERVPAVVAADRVSRWVHIDDLVDGVDRILERAAPGRDFLLTGDLITIGALVERVCGQAGVRPPRLRLSPAAARALLLLGGPLYRLRGRRPPFSAEQIASASRNWNFDDRRARKELDWSPRDLDRGLPPTVDYLRGAGGAPGARP